MATSFLSYYKDDYENVAQRPPKFFYDIENIAYHIEKFCNSIS